MEVLVLVFASTPRLARLRTIGIVCKRWGIAARLSVRHITFRPTASAHLGVYPNTQEERIACALTVLPSLTSVEIANFAHCISLPTRLQELTLSVYSYEKGGPLWRENADWWGRCLAEGKPTLLSRHFPHLVSLTLQRVIIYFIVPMPQVHTLTLGFVADQNTLTRTIANTPKLCHLTLHVSGKEWIFSVGLRTALVCLHCACDLEKSRRRTAFLAALP